MKTRHIIIVLTPLFVLNLVLRVFYLRYDFVNGDEAIRALTAARWLEGARLYVDVVTDKPPGATLFYAAVIAMFGRSMPSVHLAGILWNFLTSLVIYLIAARYFSRSTGLWAAGLFIYFSTNYYTQDTMATNTELLMALPYTASFYFFMEAQRRIPAGSGLDRSFPSWAMRSLALVMTGLMTGLAILFKQVGVFVLGFFALYELWAVHPGVVQSPKEQRKSFSHELSLSLARFSLVLLGCGIILAGLILWLRANGALADFWKHAVVLGAFYIGSLPGELWMKFMITRIGGLILFNATLWALAVWTFARSFTEYRRSHEDGRVRSSPLPTELAIGLWAAASLSGEFTSGRFYGHYFIQALPAFAILAAIAADRLMKTFRAPNCLPRVRYAVYGLVLLTFFSLVKFHHRTALLAYETLTGTRTRWTEHWGMTKREHEAEILSRHLRTLLAEGEPLYIYGYALDLYWRSGCRPATRYLTPYYVTGHFYPEVTHNQEGVSDPFWREARSRLISDLRRTRPRWIVATHEEPMWLLPYPEIWEYVRENYRFAGQVAVDPLRPYYFYQLAEPDLRMGTP